MGGHETFHCFTVPFFKRYLHQKTCSHCWNRCSLMRLNALGDDSVGSTNGVAVGMKEIKNYYKTYCYYSVAGGGVNKILVLTKIYYNHLDLMVYSK